LTKYVIDPKLLESFERTPIIQVANIYKRTGMPIRIDNGHISEILSKEKDPVSLGTKQSHLKN
jgi:hypothetical protein